jgi:hypothetical protein
MSKHHRVYSKDSPCQFISETIASGIPVPPDMPNITPGSLAVIMMPRELLDFESEIVSKSFSNNPLIANEVYNYVLEDSERKMVVISMIRGMEGMDPKIPLRKLIDEYLFSYHRALFIDLMLELCSDMDVSRNTILTTIDEMYHNLMITPLIPRDIPLIEDLFNDDQLEDEIKNTIFCGGDLRPIYEKITDSILEKDNFTMFLYSDLKQNRERLRERIVDFVSLQFEKYYIEPLLPHFKEKRQALIDRVLNLLD